MDARLQRLEDIDAIRRLTADYGRFVSWGWGGLAVDREAIRSVLSDDIHWRAAAMKVDAHGIEAVLAVIGQPQPGMDAAMHNFSNPRIDVQGDQATGNWFLWVATRSDARTDQVFQSEDLTYVRTDRGWRISSIDLHFGMTMNH